MMIQRLRNYLNFLRYQYVVKTNTLLKQQRENPLSIPVIIINFNQLSYLKELITFLTERKFENIIIIDNQSTYPPLFSYYESVKDHVTVHVMPENYGHKVFYLRKDLFDQYAKGYYILTDADIVPNKNIPQNFLSMMISLLDRYFRAVTKVGLSLRIDDIPDTFPLKAEVIKWEKQFWINELEPQVFKAQTDTTFAIYKPGYFYSEHEDFIKGLRIAGSYISKHGGWYKDVNNLSEEELYYRETANTSSSWNFDRDGKMNENYTKSYKK